MTALDRRIAYLDSLKPRLRIVPYPSEVRSSIHRLEGHLLPGLVVHRLGAYNGSRI